MRLIGSIDDKKEARTFSFYLDKKGIRHALEPSNGDQDSFELWIEDEDQIDEVLADLEKFKEDPESDAFSGYSSHIEQVKEDLVKKMRRQRARNFRFRIDPVPSKEKSGQISTFLIAFTFLIYLWTAFAKVDPSAKKMSVYGMNPVFQTLLYDYPSKSETQDQFIKLYGNTPKAELPEEGLYLYQKWQEGKEWQGLYPAAIEYAQTGEAPSLEAPAFEKILDGELWRLVTPAFVHYFLLHLFFNILWFMMLSHQMEFRLGSLRFLIFILFTSIFSNTAQYLVSGAAFMGLSGIICAMITFVFFRSKKAPWEGYIFAPSAFYFISFFILALAGVQSVSFFLEIMGKEGFQIGVANTAHLSGALSGFILAKLPLYSRFR